MALISLDDADLLELLMGSEPQLANRLEQRLQADSTVSPYVIIDTASDEIYLHGPWEIAVDGQACEPTEPLRLSSFRRLTTCVAGASDEAATFLLEGCVVAGGFTLTQDVAGTSIGRFELGRPVAQTELPPDRTADSVSNVRAGDQSAPNKAATETSSVFDDPGIDLHKIGQRRPLAEPFVAAAEEQAEQAGSPAAVEPDEVTEPEPSEHPQVPAAADPAVSVGSAASVSSAASDWNFREPPPVGRPGAERAQPVLADQASAEPSSPDHATLRDRTIESQPPQVTTTQQVTRTRRARVDFAEFGSATFVTGLVVGRNPSLNGLPAGYDAFAVGDTKVSRSHLEIRIEGADLWVRDLNSSNGSILRTTAGSTHDIPSTGAGLQLLAGDSVEFGTATARFAGWTNDG